MISLERDMNLVASLLMSRFLCTAIRCSCEVPLSVLCLHMVVVKEWEMLPPATDLSERSKKVS